MIATFFGLNLFSSMSFFNVSDKYKAPTGLADIITLPYWGGTLSSPPHTDTDSIEDIAATSAKKSFGVTRRFCAT